MDEVGNCRVGERCHVIADLIRNPEGRECAVDRHYPRRRESTGWGCDAVLFHPHL